MKRKGNLYSLVCSTENLYLADEIARNGFVSNEKGYIEDWLKKEGPGHVKGITSQPVNALKSRTGQNDRDKDKTK